MQGVDVPASVGCKTSGLTDRKACEFKQGHDKQFLSVARAQAHACDNFCVDAKNVTHSVGNNSGMKF